MSNMPVFENPCGAYSRYEITKSIPLDRLETICAAENDGRLVALPCKVGDTVYFVGPYEVAEMRVGNVFPAGRFVKGKLCNAYLVTDCTYQCVTFADFGKTVFLTRAEAEAALAERSMA